MASLAPKPTPDLTIMMMVARMVFLLLPIVALEKPQCTNVSEWGPVSCESQCDNDEKEDANANADVNPGNNAEANDNANANTNADADTI